MYVKIDSIVNVLFLCTGELFIGIIYLVLIQITRRRRRRFLFHLFYVNVILFDCVPPPSQKWEAHLVCVWWGGPGQTRDNDTVPKFVPFYFIFSFLLGQIIKKKERKWLLSNHFLNFFFLLNKREKFDNLWRYKMLFHFVFPLSKWHRRLSEQLAARVFSLSFGPHT